MFFKTAVVKQFPIRQQSEPTPSGRGVNKPMVTHKTSRGGNFSSQKKFDDRTYKIDFETGQYAAISGKHSSDCPFRLPYRRAAWQSGFRNATYQNDSNDAPINTENTPGHIINLRDLLKTKVEV